MEKGNIITDASIELYENDLQIINNSAEKNDAEILKIFCPDINKINEKDECNWTPLYRSIISGNLKATKILLKNGANPNIQCSMDETPLYQAVDMEKIDHVKLLLKNGADPNITQIDGLSPLHLAVSKQNIIIIKFLLKFKADPNKESSLYKQTPMHTAIKNNVDSMIVLILVNCGGSLTLKDKFGKMPIDYINSEEMKKTIEMLKLEKNNEKQPVKKIYFTPSKNKKLEINNVISKTIRSESPKQKDIFKDNNIITLIDSGKSKFSFIELKSGDKSQSKAKTQKINKKENENNNIISEKCNNNNNLKENKNNDIDENNNNNFDDNLRINLFDPKHGNLKPNYYAYKRGKCLYKNQKFRNIRTNNYLNISNKTAFNIVDSPILEESSSNISTNKFGKNSSKTKNVCSLSFSKSKKKEDIIINNCIELDSQKKYIRKKSTDKISCFRCESNKKVKKINSERAKTKKSIEKSLNNKKAKNSRNVSNNSFLDSTNKIGNFTTTNSNSNTSIVDTLTNYITQLSTRSNNPVKENNAYFTNKQTYNKPKIIKYSNKSSNLDKNNILLGNPIKEKILSTRNIFNSKTNRTNYTINSYLNNKMIPPNKKETKKYTYTYLNNHNKENISSNYKNSIISISTKASNGRKSLNRNTSNTSQSFSTLKTYTRNDNNTFLEIIEKSNTSNMIPNKESLHIYKWLKEIDLLIYLPLFMKKKIYSFEEIITNIKSKKIILTVNDIKKIGIQLPGHVYRILVKLEIDADLIDKKIYEYLLQLKEEENNITFKPNEENSHSLYDCCGIGCCSLKRTQIKVKVEKPDLNYKVFVSLEQWLANINMIKYKDNFIKYGFDKIEFFILQMLSSIPLEEKMIENEINIDNNNDIDLFILQLNKDIKFLTHKFKKKRSSSVEFEKKAISKYLSSKDFEMKKKNSQVSSKNCSIF